MAKIFNKRFLGVFIAVLAIASLVFGFSIPVFRDDSRSTDEKTFLNDVAPTSYIDYRIEIDGVNHTNSLGNSTAHFLGERFVVRYIIQYREGFVKPDFDGAFNSTFFDSFEITKQPKVSDQEVYSRTQRRTTIRIREYVYELELAIFKGLVEDIYYLPSVELDYVFVGNTIVTGDVGFLTMSYPHPLHVADFYGGETENVALLPTRGAFENNQTTKNNFHNFAAILFGSLALGFLVFGFRDKESHKKMLEKFSSEQKLSDDFRRFANKNWLSQKSANIRMRELESLAITMLKKFKDLEVLDFYRDTVSKELYDLFASAWFSDQSTVSYEDVGKAFTILFGIFADDLRPFENGTSRLSFFQKSNFQRTASRGR